MGKDLPLMGEVRELRKVHRAFGSNIQTLYNHLLQAASLHEFAAGLIVIKLETGEFGTEASGWQRNDFTDKALDLATRLYEDVKANLHRGFEKRKVLQNYNESKLVTNFDNVIVLSDKARSEQRAERIENGSEYKGARVIRAKVRHDTGMYWGDNMNRHNVINYQR